MRSIIVLSALLLATSAARADIAPPPDRGPTQVTVAGLRFELGSYEVKSGPHYNKHYPMAVLAGCVEDHPNCKLARERNLIGAQVVGVAEGTLTPERGMLRQIADAFADARKPVLLVLSRRVADEAPVDVVFLQH